MRRGGGRGGHKHRIQDIKQPDTGNGLWKLVKMCLFQDSTVFSPFWRSGLRRHYRPAQICISAVPTACLFTTMKRLHQQSIGQWALSPNPPSGRKVYSNPKTGRWPLSLLEGLCVCPVKSRAEQKGGREKLLFAAFLP